MRELVDFCSWGIKSEFANWTDLPQSRWCVRKLDFNLELPSSKNLSTHPWCYLKRGTYLGSLVWRHPTSVWKTLGLEKAWGGKDECFRMPPAMNIFSFEKPIKLDIYKKSWEDYLPWHCPLHLAFSCCHFRLFHYVRGLSWENTSREIVKAGCGCPTWPGVCPNTMYQAQQSSQSPSG